jgi:membrane protease subunit HflK
VYVVRGNEQAVVRSFGKARQQLVGSGLHIGWPWPMSRVDRVNLNETRTVTVGLGNADEVDDSDFLKPPAASRQSEYLTGDKNILNLQVSVQYRVDDPRQFLLQHESPEQHLRFLTQSLVADVVARSGVDYVHPLGLNALRQLLTTEARHSAGIQGLGVVVEDVTLADVRPPSPVKQAFLEVSNARAEKERLISEAQTLSERLLAQANAQASQLRDQAESARAQGVSAATADASRFNAFVDQFDRTANGDAAARAQVREMTMQRLYCTTLEELLPKLARQIYVDGQKPIDLTIQRSDRKQ